MGNVNLDGLAETGFDLNTSFGKACVVIASIYFLTVIIRFELGKRKSKPQT